MSATMHMGDFLKVTMELNAPNMIELNTLPRPKERIIAQEVSGVLVLLNLDDGQYFSLEDVSRRILELCDIDRDFL